MRIECRVEDFFNRRQINRLVFGAEMISLDGKSQKREQREIQQIAPNGGGISI